MDWKKNLIRDCRQIWADNPAMCEGSELAAYGADCSGCMTVDTFETALHTHLDIPKQKINQRNGSCACFMGVDIGAYDTCGHLCRYCYANANAELVREI